MKISNVNNLGSLIDRLCIENLKVMNLEHRKLAECHKDNPDGAKVVAWHKAMRTAAESRAALKNLIDQTFKEAIDSGSYDFIAEARDYQC
jgi:hypothetical protein